MAIEALRFELTRWDESRKKGIFTATMEWTLHVTISDDVAEMAPSVVATQFPGLPKEGTNYAAYNILWPLCTCRGVDCKQVEGGVYLYSTEWSDENSKDETQATSEDPLEDLPIIKPVGGMRDRAITKDRNDEAILNKAGDPVIQSIEDNTINIAVTCNVAVDSGVEELVVALRNRVNAAPIHVGRWYADTNMARVIFDSNFLSEVKRRNDIEYLEFNFLLSIDERDLHHGKPLNAGFRERVAADGGGYEQRTILAKDGSEPSEAVPLDDAGAKIDDPQPDTVIYLDVLKYQEGDFTLLPGVGSWSGP